MLAGGRRGLAQNLCGRLYELVPAGGTVSATNPGFTGTVTATPTAIGGTVGETAAFTVALQCTAKPTKKIVAAAAAAEL